MFSSQLPRFPEYSFKKSISNLCHLINNCSNGFRHVCPKFFTFVEISEDNFPGFSPSRLSSFFKRVTHHTESLNFSSCLRSFLTNICSLICIFLKSCDENFGCHPLICKNFIKVFSSVEYISLKGFIHSICAFSYSSH